MSHGLDEVDLSCDSVGEELGAVLGEQCRVVHPPSVVFDIVEHCEEKCVHYKRYMSQIVRGPLSSIRKTEIYSNLYLMKH